MGKKLKLKLDDLKVQSFVTEPTENKLKGGNTVLCPTVFMCTEYTVECCPTDDTCNHLCGGGGSAPGANACGPFHDY